MRYRIKNIRRFLWLWKETFRRAHRTKTLGRTSLERLLNSFKVNMKEQMQVTAILDYPRRDIRMDVGTYTLTKRLSYCAKEPETVRWLDTHIGSGDVFYDIGANIGVFSLIGWAACKGECSIYAFEPGFENFSAFCKNIAMNSCSDRVYPFQVALAEETKIHTFRYTDIGAGRAKHYLDSGKQVPSRRENYEFNQSVLAFRLDDFVERFNVPLPNLIKIDVDGGELGIVRGARKTLEYAGLRSLIIEIDEALPGHGEIFEQLGKSGFAVVSRPSYIPGSAANFIFEKK